MVYRAKEKLSRREGINLYLKGARSFSPKAGIKRRPTRPGQHGHKPVRLSPYGRQLREKQKVKRMYMMREKQFRRFYENAVRIAKNTGQDKGFVFLQLLERRLDNVIYKAGLAKSKSAARQLVSHGHVRVNGKRVDRPSYLVEIGDTISISEKVFDKYKPDYDFPLVAQWIETSGNTCKVVRFPTREEISPDIKESLIVELYSR